MSFMGLREQSHLTTPVLRPERFAQLIPTLSDLAFLLPILVLFWSTTGVGWLLTDSDTGWHIRTGEVILQNTALAAKMREMLHANYRCLYLNSPAMLAGMSSYLAAQGVDVALEKVKNRILLSSDQAHLSGGAFDVGQMLNKLELAVVQAVKDGYKGLWASGDMMWEFGTERNLPKLGEYERRLEELFHKQPALCGVCQYHCDLLPPEILRWALLTHRALFVDETLSRINPHYTKVRTPFSGRLNAQLDATIAELRGYGTA